jgi:hypothetical protein
METGLQAAGVSRHREASVFFFEKKEPIYPRATPINGVEHQKIKVFLLLFLQKKKCLLHSTARAVRRKEEDSNRTAILIMPVSAAIRVTGATIAASVRLCRA